MEIIIAVFIGAWIITAGLLAYVKLKKDYEQNKIEENKKS